ncbi:hypothetical protein SAMN05443575_0349 [Jatrophihabitans endophyticus]|uniref:Uncharacterized protein n=1 Tax=Jatrophihabitans endophyticus TaxID=1206085 RepID=A0A1M5CTU8_9ACTN|nr:hypothetical protein [Jatrophihabitans endophyticus]SHF58097.1 hypothetical protein SAMN05443575_0349 [Jatrophihabitans endophyticus]
MSDSEHAPDEPDPTARSEAGTDSSPPAAPADTEWVVIRPAGDIADSDLASTFEGEWRKRADLVDQSGIDVDGPSGVVRAVPVDRVEHSPAGHVAQVYEVPPSDDDGTEPYRG